MYCLFSCSLKNIFKLIFSSTFKLFFCLFIRSNSCIKADMKAMQETFTFIYFPEALRCYEGNFQESCIRKARD